MSQGIIKNFVAEGPIVHRRFVRLGSADGKIVQAAASTDAIIGVADAPGGAKAGDRVDVVLTGWSALEYGGAVTRGSFLTSDGNGRAVAANPSAGVNARTGAIAFYSGIAGDITDALIRPDQVQG